MVDKKALEETPLSYWEEEELKRQNHTYNKIVYNCFFFETIRR